MNSAAPLLAFELGGTILLGIISAVAFATILAVVAGLTITAATSFAHDIYANVIKPGEVKPDGEVRVARITVVVIGVLAIIGGIFANGQNVAFLVALAFAVAAQRQPADDPLLAVLEAVQHLGRAVEHVRRAHLVPRAHRVLARWCPGKVDPVTGASLSMIKDTSIDFHLIPLENPGIISIPLGVPARHPRDVPEQGEVAARRSSPRWRSGR